MAPKKKSKPKQPAPDAELEGNPPSGSTPPPPPPLAEEQLLSDLKRLIGK
jgi:hypothetical protein